MPFNITPKYDTDKNLLELITAVSNLQNSIDKTSPIDYTRNLAELKNGVADLIVELHDKKYPDNSKELNELIATINALEVAPVVKVEPIIEQNQIDVSGVETRLDDLLEANAFTNSDVKKLESNFKKTINLLESIASKPMGGGGIGGGTVVVDTSLLATWAKQDDIIDAINNINIVGGSGVQYDNSEVIAGEPTGNITMYQDSVSGEARAVRDNQRLPVDATGTLAITDSAGDPVYANGGALDVNVVQAVGSTEPVYDSLIDEASDKVTYIGEAPTGAAITDATWRIKKIDSSSNPTKIRYADGVGTFTKVWNSRAGYTYA